MSNHAAFRGTCCSSWWQDVGAMYVQAAPGIPHSNFNFIGHEVTVGNVHKCTGKANHTKIHTSNHMDVNSTHALTFQSVMMCVVTILMTTHIIALGTPQDLTLRKRLQFTLQCVRAKPCCEKACSLSNMCATNTQSHRDVGWSSEHSRDSSHEPYRTEPVEGQFMN